MSSQENLLLIEQHGHVQLLILNRPERHHAMNFELASAVAEAIDRAENDGNTRVVIITGSGEKAFCAGQDMLEMSGVEKTATALKKTSKRSSAAIAYDRVASAKLPVIAAINGICYGGGALLALACDIRVARAGSTFRFPGAEYGLVVGAAWLPRLVGAAKAKEWIFTARKFADDEALSSGLLSYVYPTESLIAEALGMAELMAQNSIAAVSESKRVIDAATLDGSVEALEYEINERLRGSDEQRERFNQATTKVTGKQV